MAAFQANQSFRRDRLQVAMNHAFRTYAYTGGNFRLFRPNAVAPVIPPNKLENVLLALSQHKVFKKFSRLEITEHFYKSQDIHTVNTLTRHSKVDKDMDTLLLRTLLADFQDESGWNVSSC